MRCLLLLLLLLQINSAQPTHRVHEVFLRHSVLYQLLLYTFWVWVTEGAEGKKLLFQSISTNAKMRCEFKEQCFFQRN